MLDFAFFESFSLLGQKQEITNWLTPVWLLSLGIALGFAMVLLTMGKIYAFSKIPAINKIGESKASRFLFGLIVSVCYIAMFVVFFSWSYQLKWESYSLDELSRLVFPLVFIVPLALLVGFGCWTMFTKRGVDETFSLFQEGFLAWTSIVCMVATGFVICGILLGMFNGFGIIKFCDDVPGMLNSLKQYPTGGVYGPEFEIPPTPDDEPGMLIEADVNGAQISWVSIFTNQALELATRPITTELAHKDIFAVAAATDDKASYWLRRPSAPGWIPEGPLEGFYIANRGASPATVNLRWRINPTYPQVWIVPWTAFFVVLLYILYLTLGVNFPKVAAISLSTFKTEVSQPLFWLILSAVAVFLVGSVYVPYNTFGEDIKMYKDSGLSLIRLLAIFMAVWAASKSVAEEIEGRTALTVLSKPVGRRQFILGKFCGITFSIGILFIILGIWFVSWTAYKPIYDGVESSKGLIDWDVCFRESIQIIPAIFLAFLEVVIFVAISVAISTRLGILVNVLICFAIYVLGHLTPLIVQSSEVVQAFEAVVVFGNLIAIIFPVLNHFDVQAAINTNSPVPLVYTGWACIYCFLYGSISLLVALVLFEDRDLA